jgi:4-hydroxythreonine-4-phosphate dehydrogenase
MEKIKIGITHGDINGISYEIIIKTFMDPRIVEFCTPIIYGSPKVLAYHKNVLNLTSLNVNNITDADKAHPRKTNIIDCFDGEIKVELGKSTEIAGEASYKALEKATKDLKEGLIDIIITAPINKNNIQSEKFNFKGHTEYLQDKFEAKESVMLLVSNNLRVGVVAGHIPIKDLSNYITKAKIVSKIEVMQNSLITDFNVSNPKIAVLGLNPHAGDNGTIGNEEINVIIPAIEEARKKGIMALGPFAADGFFGSGDYIKFDAILSMFHDQGLTAFKALAFNSGVNFTAGLPIVRTSPAHGTAYEIAGKNIASEESFKEAMYLAIDVFKNRKEYNELKKNAI